MVYEKVKAVLQDKMLKLAIDLQISRFGEGHGGVSVGFLQFNWRVVSLNIGLHCNSGQFAHLCLALHLQLFTL